MEIFRSPVIIAGQPQGYAKGTVAKEAKGIVFLAGALGSDPVTGDVPEGAGEQAKIAMEAIKLRLEEFGSSLGNILHIWIYMKGQFPDGIANDPGWREASKSIQDFWKMNHPEFQWKVNPPAVTLLGVTSLVLPQYKLEIEVAAAVA